MAINFGAVTDNPAYLRRTFSQGLPKGEPVTIVWSLYIESDRNTFGSYIAFGPTAFTGGNDYYVCFHHHTPEEFALGINGADVRGAAVVEGRWYRQAFRRRLIPNNSENFFWPDLPSTVVISHPSGAGFGDALPVGSGVELNISTVPWTGNEFVDGRMMGVKLWQAVLPEAAIRKESQSIWPVLAQYRPWLWAAWPLFTPEDVRDYSGHGRHLEKVITGTGTLTGIANAPIQTARARYRQLGGVVEAVLPTTRITPPTLVRAAGF